LTTCFFVVRVEPDLLGRRVEALQIGPLLTAALVLAFEPVPHVAHRDGRGALVLLGELVDDVEVGLAPAADADEPDADAAVGPVHPVVAGGGQRDRGTDGRGRFQEISAVRGRHVRLLRVGGWVCC